MNVSLHSIVKNHYCIGCGLCASIAPDSSVEMIRSPDGFMNPRQRPEASDAHMDFLRDLCPGITVRQKWPLRGAEKIYGHYESLHVVYAQDERVRQKASSGGGITALLISMLENSLVDGVLHVGKSETSPLRSQATFSRSREEVIQNAGSRYAPASLLCHWLELLRTGVKMAIVGKPCDIVAVSQFLEKYPQYAKQVVCKISFMCMGLPSQNSTDKLMASFGLSEDEVQDFWYRGNGWPGKATAITKQNQRHEMTYEESWGKILCKEVNFRCKICPDGFGEFADISCGDAWQLKEGKPCFEESLGRSLAFIRTEVGRKIFEQALQGGHLNAEPFDVGEVQAIQPSQCQRKIHVGPRLLALKLLGDRLVDFSGFSLYSNLGRAGIRSVIKNFWGTLKRRWAT